MKKPMEIEFKYSADKIKLSDFKHLCNTLNPRSYVEASGYDFYYTKGAKDPIGRYRAGDLNEITFKLPTSSKNNFIRRETNLRFMPEATVEKTAAKASEMMDILGYKFNFSIFKTCFIYYYNNFNLVYYIVSDADMVEQARFLEIEMLEDYPWESVQQAWSELMSIEKILKPLGIKSKTRLTKSLFQMFKK